LFLKSALTPILSGCFDSPKGKIRVASNKDDVIIYVDGEKKATGGKEYTTLLLTEGEHQIKIIKPIDNIWEYIAKKDIFIGKDTSSKITLKLVKKITESSKSIVKLKDIMYQNQPFITRYNWKEAKEYCENSTFKGYEGWRLPTREELNELSDTPLYGKYTNEYEEWFNLNKHKRYKNSKEESYFIRKEFIENISYSNFFWVSSPEDDAALGSISFKDGI